MEAAFSGGGRVNVRTRREARSPAWRRYASRKEKVKSELKANIQEARQQKQQKREEKRQGVEYMCMWVCVYRQLSPRAPVSLSCSIGRLDKPLWQQTDGRTGQNEVGRRERRGASLQAAWYPSLQGWLTPPAGLTVGVGGQTHTHTHTLHCPHLPEAHWATPQ